MLFSDFFSIVNAVRYLQYTYYNSLHQIVDAIMRQRGGGDEKEMANRHWDQNSLFVPVLLTHNQSSSNSRIIKEMQQVGEKPESIVLQIKL